MPSTNENNNQMGVEPSGTARHQRPFLGRLSEANIAEVLELGGPPAPMPAVSIILCTYRRVSLLREALEALWEIREPPQGVELIIVDDGSPDGTRELVIEQAANASFSVRFLRLASNAGLATARNAALRCAKGDVVAHTDDDCTVTPDWVVQGLAHFREPDIGVVQGVTRPKPDQAVPFFNHYIHCERFDGSFSGCNVFYRRQAAVQAGGFDPGCDYWEDTDFGWRVVRNGWKYAFASDAIIYHQVVAISPTRWLTWPYHFRSMPAKAAHYPEFRRFLFGKVWVNELHAAFDLACIGGCLAIAVHPGFLIFVVPYAVVFSRFRSLHGRYPLLKAALHFAWDVVSLVTLVTHSIRKRSLVL